MRTIRLLIVAIILCFVQPSYGQNHDDGVLRILAVGNSFSDDGMEYLPALLADLGVDNVEVARLYIGGCSLQRHVELYNKKESQYVFNVSKAGENRWVEQKEKYSLERALTEGEWDIITLQQQSGQSGIYDSFEPHLGELIDIIKSTQPQARIAWHMTWSYSTSSKHNDFARYDKSQQKMTNAIHDATQKAMAAHPEIEIVIPAATAIQSLRMSAINNHPIDSRRLSHGIWRRTLHSCLHMV